MGTKRTLNKMSKTRPRKSVSERRHRLKAQKKRLVDLGMEPEKVEKLTLQETRGLLKYPKKVKASEE